MGSDGLDKTGGAIPAALKAVRDAPPAAKGALAAAAAVGALVLLWAIVHDHDNLFVMAEMAHVAGIAVLIYKLWRSQSCAGLSRTSQEITALFLGVRLYCSVVMEGDIHTLLDALTLAATVWVVFMMRVNLAATYSREMDNLNMLFILVPCLALAAVAHPATTHNIVNRVLWAFCVYLEAVSVAPQLKLMQNAKVVERFTAFYVFSLGLARFLSCAHWLLQVLDGESFVRTALGSGLWPCMVLLSEVVQTFILADFMYYYLRSVAQGDAVVRLPTGIV